MKTAIATAALIILAAMATASASDWGKSPSRNKYRCGDGYETPQAVLNADQKIWERMLAASGWNEAGELNIENVDGYVYQCGQINQVRLRMGFLNYCSKKNLSAENRESVKESIAETIEWFEEYKELMDFKNCECWYPNVSDCSM